MPSIIINEFSGIKPARATSTSGDASRASVAQNVNIEHGDIRPWRYPAKIVETGKDVLRTIFRHECTFLGTDNPCASYTEGECDRVFSTGVAPWPAYAKVPKGENCCPSFFDPQWCRLGVPAPVNPPSMVSVQSVEAASPKPVTTSNYDCTAEGNYKVADYLGEIEYQNDPANADGEYAYAGPDDFCENVGLAANTTPYSMDYGLQLKREPRSYVYTYVNEYGEESAPSPVSEVLDVDVDGKVTLGFNIPPMTDGYCDPESIYIYRILPVQDKLPPATPQEVTEIAIGSAMAGDDPTDFYGIVNSDAFFVMEIPYREGAFTVVDDPNVNQIGESLSTWESSLPRADLQNIQMLENGSLVASEGKNLWFSDPWRYNSWNCFMNLEDCIINFKVVGAHIYVTTDGHPYLIERDVNTQNNDCACCRNVNRLVEPMPNVSSRSLVKTNTGVMWASSSGLVRMSGNEMAVVTNDTLRYDDWQTYFPHRFHGEYYRGKYFGFNGDDGIIFDVVDGMYTSAYENDSGKLTTLNINPDAVYKADDNKLYMSFDGDIFEWDTASEFMPYTWRTRLHTEAGLRNYSTMKVVFSRWLRTRRSPTPVTVRLFAEGKLMFERQTFCSKPFRLPKGFDAINFQIEVTGTEQISEIHMATSVNELINLNNS